MISIPAVLPSPKAKTVDEVDRRVMGGDVVVVVRGAEVAGVVRGVVPGVVCGVVCGAGDTDVVADAELGVGRTVTSGIATLLVVGSELSTCDVGGSELVANELSGTETNDESVNGCVESTTMGRADASFSESLLC